MTAFDRFDPFEQRITDALDEIAAAHRPDYLDDVFRQTARSSQRPRWTFPERWLPMDTAVARRAPFGRASLRPAAVLVVLLLLVLAAIASGLLIGARHRLPAPYGPAQNGQLVYGSTDVHVRDSLDGPSRLLISGPGDQGAPGFSRDGQLLQYDNVVNNVHHQWIANADGTNSRQVFDQDVADSWSDWSGDSRHLSIVGGDQANTTPGLFIVSVDGSPARKVDLGDLVPNRSALWDPQVPDELLIRGVSLDGSVDFYYVHSDGTGIRPLPVPWPAAFGKDWDLSGHAFSEDGSVIAFNAITSDASIGPGGYYRVALMNRDGSNFRVLPGPSDHHMNEAWPTFSPDGKWLTAQRFEWTENDAGGLVSLALMPADGSGVARDVIPPFRSTNGEIDATWAPDGSRLIAWVLGTKQAWSIDPVTGDRQLLSGFDDVPGWQRVAR